MNKNKIKKNIVSQLIKIHKTILILDSGVGGLSIYREVKKLLPNLYYIYMFDNDAFPYGEKSEEFIIQRIIFLIDQIQKKYTLTIAIIACNTASTICLPILRSYFKFPIIGVVPAIKPAIKLTRNGVIGLLATKITINGEYITKLIKKFAINCRVEMFASPELVYLAEKKIHGQLISIKELSYIIKPWLKMKKPPDTIVLGCTHFPLLLTELKNVLIKGTKFIDSGFAIAKRVVWLINNHKNLILTKNKNIALCTKIDIKSKKLAILLVKEGFNRLEKLILN